MEYEELYQLILDDDLGWEHAITSIIREEKMDPLNIDLVKITDRFIALVASLRNLDFRFGGKFVYTAAILLKLKSDRVMDEILNRKVNEDNAQSRYIKAIPTEILIQPKLPIIRSKKITLSQLISAIRMAIRYQYKPKINFQLKLKEVKIEDRIQFLINKLIELFKFSESVTFSSLLSKKDRKEIIYTFIPLLFLANQDKIDLIQEEEFQEIYVKNKGIR